MAILVILVGIASAVVCHCVNDDCPRVPTRNGLVEGTKELSEKGNVYFSFKGIPFAKPPVGELRFKAPEKPDNWTDVYPASKHGPHCLQKNYLFSNPKVEGSEDCLYLNVYTPQISCTRRKRTLPGLLPVMVFIHWGGFFCGYSDEGYLGPQYFMDKGVILVTFNYRLGVLGFLTTNDDASPGNYGLKDQVLALQWVQDNIEYFDGDKNRVTIFGQSAGAASVHYHMLSPSSRNLFQQAISESGTALALWARPYPEVQMFVATTQATIMGCTNTSDTSALVECLRNADGEELLNSGDKFKTFSIDPLNLYGPAVEKETANNPHPFITKTPDQYIREKKFNNVPWIVGINNEEGLLRSEAIIRQSDTREALNKNFDTIMMGNMGLQLSTVPEKIPELWSHIKQFYLNGSTGIDINDRNSIDRFTDLYSDRVFTYSTYQAALFHNLKGHDDIWFYNFNYSGQYSYGSVWAATDEDIKGHYWGVSHSDELLYLFQTPALFPKLTNKNDKRMVNSMLNLWTNFAKTGFRYDEHVSSCSDPTPVQSRRRWLRMSNGTKLTKNFRYLNIVGSHKDTSMPKFEMREGLHGERFGFWEKNQLAENIPELHERTLFNSVPT